jgi:hypothetical protein
MNILTDEVSPPTVTLKRKRATNQAHVSDMQRFRRRASTTALRYAPALQTRGRGPRNSRTAGRTTSEMLSSGRLQRRSCTSTMRAMCLFARPAHRFHERGAESAVPRPRHWFRGVAAQSWRNHGEVMLASLLGNLFAQFA